MACMTIMGVSLSLLTPSVTWRKNCEVAVRLDFGPVNLNIASLRPVLELNSVVNSSLNIFYAHEKGLYKLLTVFSPRDRRW